MLTPTEATAPTDKDLTTAIIRDPISVSPKITVREAITQMSKVRAHCEKDSTAQFSSKNVQIEARSSCVVIVESSKVIGILTERDVVRLCANQQSLDGLLVSQAMTSSVVTLRESAFKDLFSIVSLLQQKHIRHLPIVDERDCLIGLVTHETLRQILQPTDLLRLRLVREVMTPIVITSTRTDSLLAVAQHMATHRVSSVVVVKQDRPEDLPIPLGIVTERDLVQFQALELDFEYYQAAQVMSYPVISVPETETLVTVQQLMNQHLIHRVVVTGDAGELLGIVTQTDILQALSPLELYKLTEVLEAKVKQLESEKIDLLENRTQQLEEEVASRTVDLQKQLQREQAVAQLATQVRSSLSLPLILETAVEQIHGIFGCDRVNIWQFEPDLTSVVVAEATRLPHTLMGERVSDPCFQSRFADVYRQGYIRVISDIYTTEVAECHRALLMRLQIRAQVMLPLFCGEQLWGLLSVSEQQFARDWQADEIEVLRNLATQLTIAIQQASTHEQLQSELQERLHAEMQLRQSAERLQEAQRIANLGNWELNLQDNILYWSEEVFRILEIDPQQFSASYEAFLNLVHPEELHIVDEVYSQHLYNRQPYNLEHRLQMTDGRIKYVRQQCETIYGTDGSPWISRGTIQDITQQKEAEISRDRAEASLRQVIEGTATLTGEAFFPALVSHVAKALGVRYVLVAQATPDGFQVMAFSADGILCPPPFLSFDAVPCCTQALNMGQYYHPGGIAALYPDNALFNDLGVDSYLGIGLRNAAGDPIGNLCILHDAPISDPDWAKTLLSIFAARAGAELERLITAQALEQLNAELEERVAKRTNELQEREARYRGLMEGAAEAILISNTHGYIREANQKAAVLLGYSLSELSTLHITQLHPPEEAPRITAAFKAMVKHHRTPPFPNTIILQRRDGSTVPVEITSSLININGETLVQGIFRDISERQATETIIRQQAERETLLREISQRMRQSLDLQTIFETACQEIRPVLQADRVGIFKFYPDSSWNDGEFVAESVVEGFVSATNIQIHDHCFGEKYGRLYLQGRYAAMEDIYQLEHQCHTDVLALIQVRANLVMPLLCGNHLWGLLCIHQCRKPRKWQPVEIDLTQQIANQLAIAIQQASLFEQLQQELTERKQAQTQLTERNQQLAVSNTELERATRLKDEFLANMSHELRTPLNAILGMSEGLQDEIFGIVNEKQVKALRTIESSANHLLSLINDILDVAKIESGQVKLDYSQVSVEQLCSSSLTFVKQQALNKRIQLKTNIPSALPDLYVDEIRMRQVLLNLLTNAVKFTPESGTVTLSVSPVPSTQSTTALSSLRIAVEDTGIGIAPENISKLFQPFVQIDGALNRQYTGTGLGLALVKQIVNLHGGHVGLTSELGVGSCFVVDLPDECQVPPSRSLESALTPHEGGFSPANDWFPTQPPLILLAEDNLSNIESISNYLQAKGYHFVIANHGQEAIDLALAHHPDVILMDIQMPGMDGLEAMKQIRLHESLRETPIIALTALAMKGDQERCLAAGANRYLSKPVRLKQLDRTIQELLADR